MSDWGAFEVSETWRRYVDGKVDNREYASRAEVLEDGLQRLQDEDRRTRHLAELLRKGEESGDPFRGT